MAIIGIFIGMKPIVIQSLNDVMEDSKVFEFGLVINLEETVIFFHSSRLNYLCRYSKGKVMGKTTLISTWDQNRMNGWKLSETSRVHGFQSIGKIKKLIFPSLR